jgi:hypothetical protein
VKGGMKELEQPHIFRALAKATVCLLELHLMERGGHRTAPLGKVLRFKLPEAITGGMHSRSQNKHGAKINQCPALQQMHKTCT